jgi:hypothetical protein
MAQTTSQPAATKATLYNVTIWGFDRWGEIAKIEAAGVHSVSSVLREVEELGWQRINGIQLW